VTGRENAAVPAEAAAELEAHGLLAVPRVPYIAAAFARAGTPSAHRVLNIDDVEEDLAAVELRFPMLVHAALARYRLGEVTRLLRALAREQISIRDLRRILDVLLSMADTTEDDLRDMFLDDPLPPPGDTVTPVWAGWVEPRLLAFVRARLRDRVCFDSGITVSGDDAIAVHETDEAFERLIDELVASPPGPASDELLTRIRTHVWEVIDGGVERGATLLTATRTRLALRRAIEPEMPATPVLARAEIPAGVRIEQVATVTPS
jgi:flagellar biosynthesis component FlhA